ncbi:hypothetical protein Salat_1868000 [Sesamum alatum]|uniref:Uncharacterized protein n=1 Tax=Sesamum alatum TaxID=300844 RepID=A0AAE2CI50_9LAMI|nr:hypothetical protein Salat_1868000 [Sesamum alatum]
MVEFSSSSISNPPPPVPQPSPTPALPPNKRSYANIVQNLPATHFQHDPTRAAKKTFQDDSLQEIGTAAKYKEGNEDLRLILNAKRKGKKVAFVNELDPDRNGTTEVTIGKINATPSMLNNEIISVHELAIGNSVLAKIVVGDGVANEDAVYDKVGQVHVGNLFVGDSVFGVEIGDVVVHNNVAYVNNLSVTNEHMIEDDFNYDDPIVAALLDKNWDEEIHARNNTPDIIADIEAINDILEKNTFETPEKESCNKIQRKGNNRKTSSSDIDETFLQINTSNFEIDNTSHHTDAYGYNLKEGETNEQKEANDPTPTFNRF